jgi:phosphatidylinositol alpha-mannosyltransferase
MKILMVSPYDFAVPGGVNNHIRSVAREMRRAGHVVKVLAPNSGPEPAELDLIRASGNILTVPFAGSKAGISLSALMYGRVKRLLLEGSFDVLHLHEPLAPALPLFVLRHATLVPRAVRVATFHAFRRRPLPGTGNSLFQAYLRKLDGLIAVSPSAQSYQSSYFPGDARVIPNGVDLQRFGAAEPLPAFRDGHRNILYVGRLDDRKGFRHLLRAFRRVHAADPHVRLLVVGAFDDDEREPFAQQAAEWGIGAAVVFIGPVSAESLARFYRSAEIFCAPATGFESFGLVLLEAMAAGCAVVASDIDGYRSVLTAGLDGLSVPAGNAEALQRALRRLLDDDALRLRLAAAGRATAATYGWDRVARAILDYYTSLHLHMHRNPTARGTATPNPQPTRGAYGHRWSPPV